LPHRPNEWIHYLCPKHHVLKKILVIRFSSIGDIVLTTPIIRALNEQLDCEVHVLTKKQYRGLFSGNPHVAQIHSFEKAPAECFDELRRISFDHVVDLQKNLRSVKLRRALGVASSSFPKLNVKKWLLVNAKINRMPDVHIVDRYFEAVKGLDVENDGAGLEYYIPASDEVIPSGIDPSLGKGYLAMVIGGQHATKIFPPERAAQLISRISRPIVLLGGPDDKQRGDEIQAFCPHATIFNTCGTLNLNQSASLVKQAQLVITNDTGLMHIAAAFFKPILSIWGNTVPELGMYPYLPGKPELFSMAQVNGLWCRPCSKLGFSKCPKKHFNCMMQQDIDWMVGEIERLISI